MNTTKRVEELAEERNLSLFKLAQICDVSYSTLKSARKSGGQLMVDTIEAICLGLDISLSEFFDDKKGVN